MKVLSFAAEIYKNLSIDDDCAEKVVKESKLTSFFKSLNNFGLLESENNINDTLSELIYFISLYYRIPKKNQEPAEEEGTDDEESEDEQTQELKDICIVSTVKMFELCQVG